LPVRDNSHPMIVLYGSRRLRGKVCCWAAFLAKASACALVRLLSLGSDIHARMTVRRTAALAIADLPLKIPHDRDAAPAQEAMSNTVPSVTRFETCSRPAASIATSWTRLAPFERNDIDVVDRAYAKLGNTRQSIREYEVALEMLVALIVKHRIWEERIYSKTRASSSNLA
jgi:hypothetical protein